MSKRRISEVFKKTLRLIESSAEDPDGFNNWDELRNHVRMIAAATEAEEAAARAAEKGPIQDPGFWKMAALRRANLPLHAPDPKDSLVSTVTSSYREKERQSPLKRQEGASALAQALSRGPVGRSAGKSNVVAKMSTVHRPSWSRGRGRPAAAQAPPTPGSHPRVQKARAVRFVRFLSTEGV